MALQNAFGNLALDASVQSLKVVDPDGTLNASIDPSSLLLDAFDVAITTYWTTGGTAPTVASSAATFTSNTTASTASYMRTTNPFILRAQSYLRSSMHTQVNTAAVANNTRWLGIGTNQASPTAAAPVLNGAVFIWDYATGAMQAATYNAGTKTVIATLTQPTDGGFHKYEIWYRQSRVDWVIDNVVAATRIQPSFGAVQSPYMIAGSINHTTAPSTAPTFVLGGASIADQAGNNKALSDGVDQSIQATVKRGSTAAVAADLPLVVAHHPTSPTPAGTNSIGNVGVNAGTNLVGAVGVQATTPSASYYTSTGTNAAQVAKASAGYIQALILTNTSTAAQWVKVYNATTVTLGTTAAVLDIPLAAGATLSLNTGPNGVRMTTGIAYAITGAVGATNNTANTAGVLVALTYV